MTATKEQLSAACAVQDAANALAGKVIDAKKAGLDVDISFHSGQGIGNAHHVAVIARCTIPAHTISQSEMKAARFAEAGAIGGCLSGAAGMMGDGKSR